MQLHVLNIGALNNYLPCYNGHQNHILIIKAPILCPPATGDPVPTTRRRSQEHDSLKLGMLTPKRSTLSGLTPYLKGQGT